MCKCVQAVHFKYVKLGYCIGKLSSFPEQFSSSALAVSKLVHHLHMYVHKGVSKLRTTLCCAVHLGNRFASPKKMKSHRGLRATKRKALFPEPTLKRHLLSASPSPSASRPVTPTTSNATDGESSDLIVGTYNPYRSLFSEESCLVISSKSNADKGGEQSSEAQVVVNTALVARIEALEAETRSLRSKLGKHSDSLVAFYTGFQSYDLL